VREYYDLRAEEYDEWWLRAAAEREGWQAELDAVVALLGSLRPVPTLDAACGTGFITQHLRGDVTGLDQSERMVEIARRRLPATSFVVGDALALPFPDASFGRVFASYFYCHLEDEDAARFRAEAKRVAAELVVMGSRAAEGEEPRRWEERTLNDRTRWQVYKRVFDPGELASELGGEIIHAGRWFVVAAA
jgi:ubiquinone/menaquinone biosynthesis C-methylase UbiE